jgi:hypothetical protein
MRLIIRDVEALVSKYGSSRDNIFLLIVYNYLGSNTVRRGTA